MSDLLSILVSLPRPAKRALLMANDIVAAGASIVIAFYLRLGTLPDQPIQFFFAFAISVAILIPIFTALGLYHALVRFAGPHSFQSVVRAIGVYSLFNIPAFILLVPPNVPRTISLIQPVVLLFLTESSRALFRGWALGSSMPARVRKPRRNAVIYGAGSAGRQLASALQTGQRVKLIGFIDDEESLAGHTMQGVRIYSRRDLPELVGTRGLEEVLLAMPRTSRAHRNAIVQELQKFGLYVRTLPALDDLSTGKVTANDLREIEIEDLLGRETVEPDIELLRKKIADRVVLVTGAAGSIGSELCRQILDLGASTLLLYDISESGLFALERQLRRLALSVRGVPPEIVTLLGCVRDRRRLDEVFISWRPQTVYHAAAYKHVPLSEQNPAEAIRTNVFGTRNVADAASKHGVLDFVFISTDKAVRPTNVMGASKRAAEQVLQVMHERSQNRTTYSMVRFGNVLGSSGSVVPVFKEQIRNGGPVTLTHPEVTRYFMTIPEAAQLVIQAGALASGGEVFLLEMGEPVKVYDLAHAMIELSGLSVRDAQHPDGDVEISIIGLRPGEKLYEELLIGENAEATRHPRIFKAHEKCLGSSELYERLEALMDCLHDSKVACMLTELQQIVPEFKPKKAPVAVPTASQSDIGRPLRAVK